MPRLVGSIGEPTGGKLRALLEGGVEMSARSLRLKPAYLKSSDQLFKERRDSKSATNQLMIFF